MFLLIIDNIMFYQPRPSKLHAFKREAPKFNSEPVMLNSKELYIPFIGVAKNGLKNRVSKDNEKSVVDFMVKDEMVNSSIGLLCTSETITLLGPLGPANKVTGGQTQQYNYSREDLNSDILFYSDEQNSEIVNDINFGIFESWHFTNFYEYLLSRTDVSFHDMLVIPLNELGKTLLRGRGIRQTRLTFKEIYHLLEGKISDGKSLNAEECQEKLIDSYDIVSILKGQRGKYRYGGENKIFYYNETEE